MVETNRATGVENGLDTRLTSAEGTIADHTTAINDEILRATNAELAIRNDFATGDMLTLRSANAYTDKRIDNLEKDMSSGIASAAALSAVSTPAVKKGQLAFSGGYGYHNSQSAVALGAAMGLANKWSMNAGVALSNSNTTFRAGTTYVIDLF